MKRIPILVLAAFCIFFAGCGKIEIEETDSVCIGGYTQTTVCFNELSSDRYSDFLSGAEYLTSIPALEQGMIPQGIATSGDGMYLLISAYSEEKEASALFVVEAKEQGKLLKAVSLTNSSGEPFTGHVGGIAIAGDFVLLSGGSRMLYVFSFEELLELQNFDKLKLEYEIKTIFGTSFLNYSGGYLWTGFFYEPKDYPTDDYCHGIVTDGSEYGAMASAVSDATLFNTIMEAYKNGSSVLIPDFSFLIRDKIQGMAVLEDSIYLSESYGRRNDSHLCVYSIPDLSARDSYRLYLDHEIPVYYLDSRYICREYTLPPMSEGITCLEGKLCILFESAAAKYREKVFFLRSKNPTDGIWLFKP